MIEMKVGDHVLYNGTNCLVGRALKQKDGSTEYKLEVSGTSHFPTIYVFNSEMDKEELEKIRPLKNNKTQKSS